MGKLKNNLRKALFSVMSDKMIDRFYHVYYRLRFPKEMSRRCSFGEKHPDRTFYVIRPRADCVEGLMSLFMNVTKHIYFARQNGYEPIVDFAHYKTQYYDPEREGNNAWEDYFTQPTRYTLDEVYQSKHVILSGLEIEWYHPSLFERSFSDDALRALHGEIFSAIRFSEPAERLAGEEQIRLGLDYDRTLAVYLRGTDYVALKPAGHPVQPTAAQAAEVIDSYLEKYDIDRIFLVIEDGGIYEEMKRRYADRLTVVSFDRFVTGYCGKGYLSQDKSVTELSASPYQRGMNYLVKLMILSRCAYFIGGSTMGSWAACLFSEQNFLDKYVFDLGVYGK